jgi:hypothetical protein
MSGEVNQPTPTAGGEAPGFRVHAAFPRLHSPPSQVAPRHGESLTLVSLEGCGLNMPYQSAIVWAIIGENRGRDPMHPTRTGRITAAILLLSFLTACGGGGGSESPAANVVPVANAGAARTVDVGNVTLNGTGSRDADGTIASYAWTQTAGTPVTLSSAAAAQPTFVAPQNTATASFTFQLIVTDNRGASSAPSSVTISVTGNALPVANPGPPQIVASGSTVTLVGAGSSDPDGIIASYSWTQTDGSAVAMSNPNTSTTVFTAPVASTATTLSFQLVVRDNRGAASAAASVTISVNANRAPVANAGSPRTVGGAGIVQLNGTASSDPDGTVTAWSWTQIAGTAVTMSNANTATPTFTAPAVSAVPAMLTFSLVVTDNGGLSSTASTVTITVNPNSLPVANAGPGQNVVSGTTVTLDGRGSADPDGSVVSYAWTQSAGAAVTLSGANTARPTFVAPDVVTPAMLTFQLVVTDNAGSTSPPSSVTIRVDANARPVAIPGISQTVGSGAAVTLNPAGARSVDVDGSITAYAWTQTAGTAVTLNGASTLQPTFTAPTVTVSTALTFALVVTDNLGATSPPATVTITVTPYVTLSGTVRFQRVPFQAGAPYGLDYANPVWRPARAIAVKATQVGGSVVGTAVTDANGNYTMSVPSDMNITIHAVARMVRDGTQPLPRWDVRVQPILTAYAPLEYFSGFTSSSSGTYNVDIASGVAPNGTATTARTSSSGPFAILDTIYTAMQAVLSTAPNTSFPELYVDWGGQTEGTFFTTANGQHIALQSDLTEDTDEYDQHVIAHEFGHYVERNFSRADNIGGSHGFGDRLDMRVAFGEGFGYAFAAIVLNDSFTHDSYVFNGTQRSSVFDVETNPPATGADAGCWCSESSVWSVLWDLYDNVPDGNDNISLPFSALWNVLVGPQRLTPSVTSIFSYVSALKVDQPAFAGLINSLLSAQNINSGTIDAFATNETYLPYPAMTLPLIPTVTKGGGPVVVRSIGDANRHYNKAGNRALLRFTALTSGPITVSLTTSNLSAGRDPDFYVRNNGTLFWGGINGSSEYPETETFSVTAGQTYIIDAFDCANGCSGASIEGTPGDYDLTVTIN